LNHFRTLEYNTEALMNLQTRRHLPRNLSQESWLRKRQLQDSLLHLFGSHGYQVLEMPILEPTEMFLRKSGGELASQMFSFLDPGSHAVSLRPELTAPIMVHYLEHASEIDLPARWQYSGPVFRYDAANLDSTGQFTQVGAELIGSASVMADAELMGLAAQVPLRSGLDDFTLALGDLQVIHSILDPVELSDRARSFIIGSVPQLREGKRRIPELLERAWQLHLTGHNVEDEHLSAAISGLNDEQAREVLKGFLGWSEGEAPQLGQRDADEVVQRLLRKVRGSDAQGQLERGLELIAELTAVRGEPLAAIDAARRIISNAGASQAALDRLGDLVTLLLADPALSSHLAIDFGLARGIAYYNGVIFEVTHPAQQKSLGGGGRYDPLARALGSPEGVPAAGFAYNLDSLMELEGGDAENVPGEGVGLLSWPASALVLADGPDNHQHAIGVAREMRQDGLLVELDVGGRSLEHALSYASGKGFSQVVLVGEDGKRTIHQAAPGKEARL
jgi:histidyl-tRNA synthetase